MIVRITGKLLGEWEGNLDEVLAANPDLDPELVTSLREGETLDFLSSEHFKLTRVNEVQVNTRAFVVTYRKDVCCTEGHAAMEDAFACGLSHGWNSMELGVRAIDWAFGLRAFVPTFGSEWVLANKLRQANREKKS